MNIFFLDLNPHLCARYHNDKHVVKMILEYCQLLSTAHRILDGTETIEKRYVQGSLPARYRHIKRWSLNDYREKVLLAATHINHPSAVWARSNKENYSWLARLSIELLNEYTYRYGKTHAYDSRGLVAFLADNVPKNIPQGEFTGPTPAMPDEVKITSTGNSIYDSVMSYRNYYIKNKTKLASWKGKVNGRDVPSWYHSTSDISILGQKYSNGDVPTCQHILS